MHSLISGIIPNAWNTQDTIHIPNEAQEEVQSMDTLVLFRRGNKTPTGGDTKCVAETEEKIILRLPH